MNMAYAVFSRYKKGTKKFHRLATLHWIVEGHRLTLGVEVVHQGDDAAETVRRLLWRARRRGIRMSSITVDRGFHSVDIIETIKATGIPLVMPAVKLEPVKDILKKYEVGEREAVSAHTITNSAGRSTTYTLAILEEGGSVRKKYAKMSQEERKLADLHDDDALVRHYYVFATTMSEDWIGGDPHRVAEFYRRRWGIENSYKSYEAMRPRTTSTDYSVRILLWFIPFILYNIWILARFMAARGGGHPPRRVAARHADPVRLHASGGDKHATRRQSGWTSAGLSPSSKHPIPDTLLPRIMPGLLAAAPSVPHAAPACPTAVPRRRIPGCDLDDGRTQVALERPWPS